jgi:hypothetical protein
VEGDGGEDGPGQASDGEGDEVAAVGLGLGNQVEDERGPGEADDRGDGGPGYFGAVWTGVLAWGTEERDETAAVGEDGEGAGLEEDCDV